MTHISPPETANTNGQRKKEELDAGIGVQQFEVRGKIWKNNS